MANAAPISARILVMRVSNDRRVLIADTAHNKNSTLADTFVADQRTALTAGFAQSIVHAQCLFEIPGLAVAADKIAQVVPPIFMEAARYV